MLRCWPFCLSQNKISLLVNKEEGFTLIELILAIAISSVLFLSFYSVLNFNVHAYKKGDEIDDILINGQYAIEYIKDEVRSADKIISVDKVGILKYDYPDNIGFVIMRYYPKETYKYNYSTYYLKNNKIYRIAENKISDGLPNFGGKDGHNVLAEYVISIGDTSIDFAKQTIDLDFLLKGELEKEIRFKTKIFIRCPIIY